MVRAISVVHDDILTCGDGEQRDFITLGTAAWYDWLSTATSFSFCCPEGSFTARKESFQRGGCYWKAYRSRSGKLKSAYLGKAERLTVERLREVAVALAPESDAAGNARNGRAPDSSLNDGGATSFGHQLQDPGSGPGQMDDLIDTKISLPPDRPGLVARPRLIRLLHQGTELKLTLLSAPPGSGKTALLSHWSHLTMRSVAWVSLGAEDNDPIRFWSYVITALRTVRANLGSETLTWLRAANPSAIQPILTRLINALAAGADDLVLVLDDYHVIHSPEVHQGMTFLLERLPPNAHLAIASRVDPPLPLAGLRAKGQLMEVRPADLSFTRDEAATFLGDVMGLRLNAEDVSVLERRTEGWIAGLQLAALSLRQREDAGAFIRAFSGDNRHVFDYLVEEVLRRSPTDIQTFLLQTSLLERLSGSLCEAVTGRPNGQRTLEVLDRDNLFTVPLDDERRWYRYHLLFREALRAHLRRLWPEQEGDLHRKACAWYVDNGLTSEGVRHALEAHDFELAADLIEGLAPALLKRSEMMTLLGWFSALPDELVRARPLCCILQAWVFAGCGQVAAAEARLRDAERCLGPSQDRADRTPENERAVVDMAVVRAIIADYRGEFSTALAESHQALELSRNDEGVARNHILLYLGLGYWRSGDLTSASRTLADANIAGQAYGDVPTVIVNLSARAGIQVARGRLREAAKLYEQALRVVEGQSASSTIATGAPHIGLGWLLYEWNDLDAAASRVSRGIELSNEEKTTFFTLRGYDALARVLQAQGNLDGAYEALRQAEHLARSNELTYHAARLATYRVRLWLQQGNLEAAAKWAQDLKPPSSAEPTLYQEAEYLTLARVQIAQNRPGEAAELLGRLLKAAETAERQGALIKILGLWSLALQAKGETDAGLAALGRALTLAEPEGYIRTFIDLGGPMAALLYKLAEMHPSQRSAIRGDASLAYLRVLLAAFSSTALQPQNHAARDDQPPMVDPLSERELEVLKMIAAGLSTPQIADDLVVAVSTVRTHVQNIYGKLGSHNRTNALARARDLGLLL